MNDDLIAELSAKVEQAEQAEHERECQALFGGSRYLQKANEDPFMYCCRLITGEHIYFTELSVSGEYLLLRGIERAGHPPGNIPDGRGIEVRRDAIVWIVDNPDY